MTVSRDQFDETKNYTEPEWQEGVPVMDADLNLAMKIGKTGLRRAVCDFIGNGSANDGFKLSGSVTDPTIHFGNIWIAGLRIELPDDISASAQPNAPVEFPSGDGVWYLDVYEWLYTSVEDPSIRDSRLPSNVETPIKVWKTEWTLRKVLGASLPAPEPSHYYLGVAIEAGGALTDVRNDGMILAGGETGYQDRTGSRPGSGHRHRGEDIDVESPNFTGDTLDEVLDEIDSRIETVEGGVGAVGPHAATHASGGSDPVSVAGLPGQCTQSQVSPAHSLIHVPAFNNGLLILPDVNGNTTLGAHLLDAAIHGGGSGVTAHPALTGLDWSAAGHILDTHLLPKDALAYRNLGSMPLRWGTFYGIRVTLFPSISNDTNNSLEYNNLYLTTDFAFKRDWGAGVWDALHITHGLYKGSDRAAFKTGANAVFDSNNRPIVNVPTPTDAMDAASKSYVDGLIGGIDVAKYKYPDILVDDSGGVDAVDIPAAFALIPAGGDRHIAFRRGNYLLAADQSYSVGGLLMTGAGEASRIYASGTRRAITLSAGDNNIVKITGFQFDNVTLIVNGAKEVHIAECVFGNSDLYIGTSSEPVEWGIIENNRFIETEIFYPGTAGNVDHITIKNNYFKRTGIVSSGILDLWWDPEEIFVLDNVIDVSGVTQKNTNPDWYYIIDANTHRNAVIRGNTIIMPTANPADQVVGVEAGGDEKGMWIIEGNKFIGNLTRGESSVGHVGVSLFTNDPDGPFFLVSGNYFVDFNVNQGDGFDNDFSIVASGTYAECVVVRNNIHKNCNHPCWPLTGMNMSGDVSFA